MAGQNEVEIKFRVDDLQALAGCLRRAGFRNVRKAKVRLSWDQFACAADLRGQAPEVA